MLKKSLFSGAGLMLLAGFLFGTDTVSYFTTSASWLRDSVKESVPLEFEIERARTLVKDLSSDVEKNMGTIATEEVQVEKVKKQIQQLQETLSNERLGILRLQEELSTDKDNFEFSGKTFTKEQVKTDLANRFERFKTNEATLTSLNDMRTAREKGLAAAQQKLQGHAGRPAAGRGRYPELPGPPADAAGRADDQRRDGGRQPPEPRQEPDQRRADAAGCGRRSG